MNPKIITAQIIEELILGNSSLAFLFPKYEEKITPNFKPLTKEICFGVARWFYRLDFIAQELLHKPLKQKDYYVYALILIGLYQLNFMKTPENIVVSELVDAAKKCKKVWATGIVNAVLRNFLRQKEKILSKADQNIVAKYSHPKWLIAKIQTAFPNDWQNILDSNNKHPPLALRVNVQKISRDEFIKKLAENNIAVEICSQSSAGIILPLPVSVKKIPGFVEGEFSVQDCAAQFAAEILDLKPSQIVLDACAAPGGKTTHILEIEPQIKKLLALDCDKNRLGIVKENLQRLNFSADLICANAEEISSWWNKISFDRILLDAPCSATGVIRRHPDIKLLRRESDVKNLATTQIQLLKSLWQTLKPGGKVLYVTCSILPEENSLTIEKFLSTHNDAKEIHLNLPSAINQNHGVQILPGKNKMDGFYFALLEKIA